MKKIIELAENYLVETRILTLEGDYYKCGVGYELAKAIEHRRKLEQTPITENWLKEHGFIDEPQERMLIYRKGAFGIECDLTTWEWYWANGDVTLHSLADLYDAAELCGINLED